MHTHQGDTGSSSSAAAAGPNPCQALSLRDSTSIESRRTKKQVPVHAASQASYPQRQGRA